MNRKSFLSSLLAGSATVIAMPQIITSGLGLKRIINPHVNCGEAVPLNLILFDNKILQVLHTREGYSYKLIQTLVPRFPNEYL